MGSRRGGGSGRRAQGTDAYGARARKEGFPARSVYKLEEIDRRVSLFRTGMSVLDLGAFPGSWTMYAAKRVGAKGRVIGIDIQPFDGSLPPHATIVCADMLSDEGRAAVGEGPFDVVMSDMAPATTGHRQTDMYRSYELAMEALAIAESRLSPSGAFVAKIFQGPEFEDALKRLRATFQKTRILRPKATRKESYEVFLYGLGLKRP